MLKNKPIHPIFFGLFPVLSLYSLNTAIVSLGDVPVPLLLVVIATCLVWALLAVILRSATRGAMGASVAVVLFFAYGHIWNLVEKQPALSNIFHERTDLIWVWAPVFVLAIVFTAWKWKRIDSFTMGMNVGGLVLAGFPLLSILSSWFTALRGVSVSSLSGSSAHLKVTDRPDIYYIILDGYGRSDALKRVIGFDNAWFVNGLEKLGFYVAKDSRSNYCQTELSLSSSLNLDYLPTLLPNMKVTWDDRKVLDNLIDENHVSKYLRGLGYRYEAVTTGFPSVRPYSADVWFRQAEQISFFSGVLMNEMPFTPENSFAAKSRFAVRRDSINAAFDNLATSASSIDTQPRFVFAHVLAPHPPFVFGARGEATPNPKMGFTFVDASDFMDYGGTPAEYQKGYADQATYISHKLLDLISKMVKSSSKPPIIILQGDHGSKLRLNQQLIEKTDLNECFPNLNAYLVPKSVKEKLYPNITPVNSFRVIFDGLFDDKLPLLPDRSYYSGWLTPFQFVDVSDRVKSPAN